MMPKLNLVLKRMLPEAPTCMTCGCRSLEFDASAKWSVRWNKWIYQDVRDSDPYCPKCEDTIRKWDWTPKPYKIKDLLAPGKKMMTNVNFKEMKCPK